MCLSSSGEVLESVNVTVHYGLMLGSPAAFELLDVLKEVRVKGEVCVLGIKDSPLETIEMVQDIKDEMVAPNFVEMTADRSQRSGICSRTSGTTINLCIEHMKGWPAYSANDDENAAALHELTHAFEIGDGERGEMHFPVGSKPMDTLQVALLSIEATYAKIDQERYKKYPKEASKAKERHHEKDVSSDGTSRLKRRRNFTSLTRLSEFLPVQLDLFLRSRQEDEADHEIGIARLDSFLELK